MQHAIRADNHSAPVIFTHNLQDDVQTTNKQIRFGDNLRKFACHQLTSEYSFLCTRLWCLCCEYATKEINKKTTSKSKHFPYTTTTTKSVAIAFPSLRITFCFKNYLVR